MIKPRRNPTLLESPVNSNGAGASTEEWGQWASLPSRVGFRSIRSLNDVFDVNWLLRERRRSAFEPLHPTYTTTDDMLMKQVVVVVVGWVEPRDKGTPFVQLSQPGKSRKLIKPRRNPTLLESPVNPNGMEGLLKPKRLYQTPGNGRGLPRAHSHVGLRDD